MGIKNLNNFIKKYAPNAIKVKHISEYKNKKIAIDISLLLYKIKYTNLNHIQGLLQKILFFMTHRIHLLFVFDGIPPDAKKRVINKRIRQKQKIEQRMLELPNGKVKDKLGKQLIYITREEKEDCKNLLTLLGIPSLQAVGEAESLCAELNKSGIVDYVYTEDTDSLAFGSPFMIKQFNGLYNITEISLDQILKETCLNQSEFIDLCILCGCDYSNNLPRINYDKAFSLVKEYSTIETILNHVPIVPDQFNFLEARSLFTTREEILPIPFVVFNEKDLIHFLLKQGMSNSQISYFVNTFKTLHLYPCLYS